MRPKFIASLTLRGFDRTPQEVEVIVGRPASLSVARGESRKVGTRCFHNSAVGWKLDFPDATRLDEMIPTLLASIGGVENLANAIAAIKPQLVEVDVSMWIKDSEDQEGGFFSPETVAALGRLGASLSLGFYTRSDA